MNRDDVFPPSVALLADDGRSRAAHAFLLIMGEFAELTVGESIDLMNELRHRVNADLTDLGAPADLLLPMR